MHSPREHWPRGYHSLTHSRAVPDYRSEDDRVILTQSESEYEAKGNCGSMLKYAIFAFNIISLLVGTITLAMGAWLRVDSRFRDFLSERYRQVVAEEFWQAPTLYTFSYLLIVLGCTMIVVAMFGCCGVIGGLRPFLACYAVAVFLLLLFTIGCIVYILYKKDGIDVELADALNYMVQHYYQGAGIVQESLDRLQQAFRCCGNAGCSDFRVFRQDPPRTCDIRCDGCHYRIMLALRIGFSIALAVFAIVILGQFVAIASAAVLIFRGEEEEEVRKRNSKFPVAHYYRDAENRAYNNQRRLPTETNQTLGHHAGTRWTSATARQSHAMSSQAPAFYPAQAMQGRSTRGQQARSGNPYALDLKQLRE